MNLLDYSTPGAYEAITVSSDPIGITTANLIGRDCQALIGVETDAIRIRCDGTDPTDAVGYKLADGDSIVLTGKQILSNLKMIRVTTDASVKVILFHSL